MRRNSPLLPYLFVLPLVGLLTFVFGLVPGEPPVQVMLTILAVIGCAATLQTAGGLNLMMQVAERLLRRHPQYITILAPLTTWTLTFLCGTGHVVYTMFPIIYDIAIKEGVRPERPMAVASIASQIGISTFSRAATRCTARAAR